MHGIVKTCSEIVRGTMVSEGRSSSDDHLQKRHPLSVDNRLNIDNSWPIQNMLTFTLRSRSPSRKSLSWASGVFAVLVFLLSPSLALAGDSTLSDIFSFTWPEETTLPDRLMIRGGYGYAFGATTTLQANGPAGSGSSLDFEDDLGGETSGNLGRADILFRFNSRHAVGGTWYKLNRDGDLTAQQDFNWDGLTFRAGAAVHTDFDIELFRLWYMWSFYRGEDLELAFSPGVYLARLEANIRGTLTVADTDGPLVMASAGTGNEDLTLPLPSFGLIGNYKITPRLTANVRGDGFYLAVDEWSGWMAEAYVGLDYRVLQNFSLGAAYDFFAVNVERDNTTQGWQVDNYWNIVYLYASLYFFDTPLSD